MIQLGVIIAKYFLPQMASIEQALQEKCELTIRTYSEIEEIPSLYRSMLGGNDCVVVSEIAYYYLIDAGEDMPLPTYKYELTQDDFYKYLFQLCIEQRFLDFSRVSIDFLWEGNNYMGLKETLDDQFFPHSFELNNVGPIYKRIIDHHLNLWNSGKIDLILTRFGNIVELLKEDGIPYKYIYPSKKSIIRQFEIIINEIDLLKLSDNQIAISRITINDYDLESIDRNAIELKTMLLHKALLEFTMDEKIPFLIQKTDTSFEIMSSAKDLQMITDNHKRCKLFVYLEKSLPFEVKIGWGTGDTLYKARSNAELALQLSAESRTPGTYIVQKNGQLIGPLASFSGLEIRTDMNEYIQKLSDRLNISAFQIQKIMAVLVKTERNEITSEELAFHLGIALRSANRILKQLVDKGAAKVLHEKQEKIKGRPKKVYLIDWNL